MLKRLLGISLFSLLIPLSGGAQTAPDTADYPYWIDMMADPSVNFYQTQRAFNLYWENRTDFKGNGYKPFKRWEYSMLEIIDSNGNIPAPGTFETEIENYMNARRGFGTGGGIPGAPVGAPCLTSGNWVELGPYSMPSNKTGQPNGLGRINALAFHPTDSNKIFAGAPAGGLWISNDMGSTWTTYTDTLATLGVSSIVLDPIFPDTMYMGTGDRDASDSYGRGVWKSMDGGITWTQTSSGMGNVTVGRLIIHPTYNSVLIAATSGGIYRTTNAGTSWSRVQTGNFKEIVFDAVNPDYVFAATGASFYRSTDNGVNWTQITSGLPSGKSRMVIGTTPADSNFVYALVTESRVFDGLYLSTNRGVSFTQMSDTPNIMDYSHLGSGTSGQAWYDLDIAVDPVDKAIVYSAGVNIFQSLDSGKTWTINAHWVGSGGAPDVHADNHILEYQYSTNTLFTGNDGGVYYTKDRGDNWTEISSGMGIAQIYRLGQSALNKNYVINGYQDNGTGSYLNGSWYTIMGGDGMDCVINPSDDTWSYSDLYYGDVRRYKNNSSNGTIAKNGTNGINESGGWVTPFILRESTPSTMFIGYKNVWRSTNVTAASASSVSWTKISNNIAGSNGQNITVLENSSVDDDLLYVARADKKFYKSENVNAGSPTWTDLTSSLPNSANVDWIETHRSYRDRVWICQSNKVYQSDDGGSNWTNISSGLPNIPILCLVHDSSSQNDGVYAGTYMGVFYKDTTMSSWSWYNDKMPINTRVRDIEIYYDATDRSKSHVIAATYGRGNWRSPLYDEDQKAPLAGFSKSAGQICQNSTVEFTDTSLYLPTRWSWEISPGTYSYVNGTDSTSQNPIVQFNAKGKYTIKMWAANCKGVDSVFKSDEIEVFDPIKSASCTNITTTIGGYGIGIYGVDIHDYSNTSTGPNVEGDYVDRACRDIIYLKSDTGYFTTITTGSSYNEYVKIFIDFNNNGNLNDAGELVFDGPRQKTTHQDTIRIPANPTTNTLLRMRIMSDYDTIPANACDTLHYGQTEDYGVVIEQREAVAHFVIDTNRVCQNGKIVLTDSSSGGVYKRRWYVSQYGLLTFKSDSAGPITFTLPDTGWYYAELVLNDSQVYKRIDSIVYVQPNPTATLSVMSGSTLSCEGDNITFTNGGSPTGFITSTWYRSGSLISGANSTIFPISNLTVSDTGTYSSIVDWNGCTANAGSTYLYVNPEPSASFNSNKDSSCYINNDFIFTNTSTLSSGTFSSAWDLGDGSTSSATDVNHSYADTGTYAVRLVVRTPSNCTDTAWKTVKVQESPSAGFTANMFNQCFKGNSFSFTNNSSISSGTLTSNWIFGDGNSSTDTDPIHAYGTTGSFTVQLISSSGICSDTLTQTANVYVSPVADFSITAHEACGSDNSFDFTDNSSISTGTLANYDWDFDDGTTSFNANHTNKNLNGSGDFDIGLIVTSDQGCKDTITQTVTVAEKPVAGFTLTIGENCLNGNRLQVASTSTVGTGTISQFSWDYGDGTSTLGSNPVDKSYTAAGIYAIRLIVVTDGGCKDTVTQNTIIHPSPMANFDTVGGCVNEEFTFANTSTIVGGGLTNFLWTFGDGKTSVDQSPLHSYTASGTYEVSLKVTTDQGCTDSILKKSGALILANPGADFSYERVSSSGTISEVQFTDLSSDAITWLWNLGPAGNSTQQNPTGTYLDSGTFGVTLWVENADGCSDSVMKSILIFPSSNFMVPNGFTPNGDGINEEFKPVGLGYMKEYRLTIYNRWGMMVFTTNNPQDAWDGKFNGEYVLPGLYLVTMEYLDLEGNRGRYDQMINVMR